MSSPFNPHSILCPPSLAHSFFSVHRFPPLPTPYWVHSIIDPLRPVHIPPTLSLALYIQSIFHPLIHWFSVFPFTSQFIISLVCCLLLLPTPSMAFLIFCPLNNCPPLSSPTPLLTLLPYSFTAHSIIGSFYLLHLPPTPSLDPFFLSNFG